MPKTELILGNCKEYLETVNWSTIDAVITDPPFGISHQTHGQLFKDASTIEGDSTIDLAVFIHAKCKEHDVPLAMFFSPYKYFTNDWRSVLVWNKGDHVGIGGDRETCWKRDVELIGVAFNKPLNGKRDSSVLNYKAVLPPPSGHFAEKPVRLMEYLVKKLTNIGDTVLDPCIGSGTTGVVAKKLNRNFIGIEIDRHWYDVANKRINNTVVDCGFGLEL